MMDELLKRMGIGDAVRKEGCGINCFRVWFPQNMELIKNNVGAGGRTK